MVRRLFALNQIYSPWQALEREASGHEGFRAGRGPGLRVRQQQNLFATATSDRAAPPRTGSDPEAELAPAPPKGYATLLKDVTIYTSLESCAQCSGIMCLASVEIVYLQWDQGRFLIGNIMHQASFRGGWDSWRRARSAATSLAAAAELAGWTQAMHPDGRPTPAALTNQQVLTEARDFLQWAKKLDNRGAAHRA